MNLQCGKTSFVKLNTTFLLLIFYCPLAFAQAPDTLWTKTYGGSYHERCLSGEQTVDGGYIIAAETQSYGAGAEDVWLIKTDANGNTLWTRTYGGYDSDVSRSSQQTSDGGYIVAGSTESYGPGVVHIYLIKTDSLGDTLWTRTYEEQESVSYSVQQTSDGGYIIGGSIFIGYDENIYLIKTDSLGDTLWTKVYGGGMRENTQSVKQTSNGGYIIGGTTASFGAGSADIWLLKTDSLGDTLWTKTYGGWYVDGGRSVQQTSEGGYIIAGYTYSFGAGSRDAYVIKTNASGDTLWTKTYGGWTYDFASAVQQTSDDGYIILGHTSSFGAGGDDVWLIKTAPDTLGIKENQIITPAISLLEISPNPFRDEINFKFSVGYGMKGIELEISDVSGRLVKQFNHVIKSQSSVNTIIWDGFDNHGHSLPNGVYFVRFKARDHQEMRKLVLIR